MAMQQIPITELFDMLERFNGMTAMPAPMDASGEAPVAADPLHSHDPLVRAAAEELAAKAKPCASRAA
jgi:hypothetical protein